MYKSRRRPWVKLYCRDWLTSTVRFQLTPLDRSVFIDLLAMAGDSRFPGLVAAGYETDSKSPLLGYPLDWLAAQMSTPALDLRTSLRKLEAQERIKVREYEGTFIIQICAWDKYQSEYLRQIQRFGVNDGSVSSPQKHKQTSGGSTQLSSLEVEGDLELEKETPLTTFADFWASYPRKQGKLDAQRAWKKITPSEHTHVMSGLERWKKTEQWTKDGGKFAPHPATFLNRRRWEDEVTSGNDFEDRFNRASKAKP